MHQADDERWHWPALALSRDGSRLALAQIRSFDNESRVDVLDTGTWQRKSYFHVPTLVRRLAFSADGNKLLVQHDNQLLVWDANAGRGDASKRDTRRRTRDVLRPGVPLYAVIPAFDHHGFEGLSVSPGDFVTAGWGGDLHFWDAESYTRKHQRPELDVAVSHLQVLEEGRALASFGSDGALFWDLQSGAITKRVRGRCFAYCQSKDLLAVQHRDKALTLHSPASAKERAYPHPMQHGYYLRAVAFSPDCSLVAAAGDKGVQVCRTNGADDCWHVGGELDRLEAVAIDDQGRVAVSGNSGLWLLQDGEPLSRLETTHERFLAFTAHGLLASGGTCRILDPSSGDLVYQPALGHVLAVAPDSSSVICSDGELGVDIHALPSGQLLHKRSGHQSAPGTAAYFPDGRRIATGGGSILFWELDPAAQGR